jgi:hypothetical protein
VGASVHQERGFHLTDEEPTPMNELLKIILAVLALSPVSLLVAYAVMFLIDVLLVIQQ